MAPARFGNGDGTSHCDRLALDLYLQTSELAVRRSDLERACKAADALGKFAATNLSGRSQLRFIQVPETMLAPSDVHTIEPYLCFEVRRGRCGRASEIFDGNVMRQAMVYSEHGFEFHCNNRGFFLPDSKARSPQKYDRYSQGQPIS